MSSASKPPWLFRFTSVKVSSFSWREGEGGGRRVEGREGGGREGERGGGRERVGRERGREGKGREREGEGGKG